MIMILLLEYLQVVAHVKGALTYANDIHADTVALSCNTNSEISAYAEHILEVNVGPEVLTGSTRLKSGTAQNSY